MNVDQEKWNFGYKIGQVSRGMWSAMWVSILAGFLPGYLLDVTTKGVFVTSLGLYTLLMGAFSLLCWVGVTIWADESACFGFNAALSRDWKQPYVSYYKIYNAFKTGGSTFFLVSPLYFYGLNDKATILCVCYFTFYIVFTFAISPKVELWFNPRLEKEVGEMK